MKSVYIETSIPSYLTARPSRDVRAAAWQELTVQWWDTARRRFDLYTSEIVVAEAREGDPAAAEFDALHVALAAVHAVDFLLTWNCRHINNADTKPTIRSICGLAGYVCPEICTPQELLPEEGNYVP